MTIHSCANCGSHSEPLRQSTSHPAEMVCVDIAGCLARAKERLEVRSTRDLIPVAELLWNDEYKPKC